MSLAWQKYLWSSQGLHCKNNNQEYSNEASFIAELWNSVMYIDDMTPYQLFGNLEYLGQWLDFIDIGNKSMDKHSHITMQVGIYRLC